MAFRRDSQEIPVMTVGKYANMRMDKLPLSYLRWMMTQDFPKPWLAFAKKKLEASDFNDMKLSVTRHAIDMFSKRFIHVWIQSEGQKGDEGVGLASFIAMLADEAWEKGEYVRKPRHQDDGIVKELRGMRFVFKANPSFEEYRTVITIMEHTELVDPNPTKV